MNDRILILGASGYMGSAFVTECRNQDIDFHGATRAHDRYANLESFELLLDQFNPSMVVNCAAFIPTPSVDLCKNHRIQTLAANVIMPDLFSQVCKGRGVPFIHLSTGCLFDEQREYAEADKPIRTGNGYCGFYVETKLWAEELVLQNPNTYVLRLRLPFDEFDHPRNYLSKLASFPVVYRHVNSLSHRGDFVKAALDLWRLRAPFGIYHVSNPGFISADDTLASMALAGMVPPDKWPQFVDDPKCTGCKLSAKKLLDAGVKMRDVHEALDDALGNWKPAHV